MEERQMFREIKVKRINPLYAVGLVWLVYGLFFSLYRLSDLLLATSISIICYLTAGKLIPSKTVIQPLTEKGELDKRCMEIIEQGYAYIDELVKASQRVDDGGLRGQINDILETSRQMLDYTAKNPRLALDLRNFTDYYFPVTLKLINAHTDMGEQTVRSDNVKGIIERVRSVMGTVVPAFAKQLDSMYAEKQLDIKTDIEVLKGVLAAEGLTESGEGFGI